MEYYGKISLVLHTFYIANRSLTLNSTDPDSSRVREMISQYYEIVELSFDEELFSNVALYVRRNEAV